MFKHNPAVVMTEGPIYRRLLAYALPIAIVNVMHRLFNTVDIAVLGIFAGDLEVAAVGATTSLITLINSVYVALGSGVNVLVAKYVGAKNQEMARKTVGTAMVLGVLCGLVLMSVVLAFGETFLIWMKCDPVLLPSAAKYLRIYFCGMPFIVLYSFLASSLRGTGDSVRPMIYMLIAGVLNIVLNVVFVAILKVKVEGVAVATVLSQTVALMLTLRTLLKSDGYSKVEKQNVRLDKRIVLQIVKIGIPISVGSVSFYVANVVIQTAVNTLGAQFVTANAVASQFDGFIYTVGSAIATATMVFVAQNVGAMKLDRIKKGMFAGVLTATGISLLMGILFVVFSDLLCSIVTQDPKIILLAQERMRLLCLTYFTASIMEVLAFSLRAMGWYKSTVLVSFLAGLGMRVIWVKYIWPLRSTLGVLYTCYPVSNVIAIGIYLVFCYFALKKLRGEQRLSIGR